MADLFGTLANVGQNGGFGPVGQTFGSLYNAGSNLYNNLSQPAQQTAQNSANQYFQPRTGSVLGAQTTAGGSGGSSSGSGVQINTSPRSEERRVGKECRS